MSSYEIASRANRDLESIRDFLDETAGSVVADRLVEEFYRAFRDLVRLPSLGHLHRDVRNSGVLVYRVYQYLVLFRRTPQVQVLRIVHGARDLPRLHIG